MVIRETRRVSSSGRAQQLWDAIKAVRLQKQIPAITRMGRYMNRFYQLKKDDTQKLLDLAVEDNLIKLENKIGTKGTKSGVEEKAYRLPTSDMLPRERHDWYCFHCHTAGEVILCSTCHRVYHEPCIKDPINENEDFICRFCRAFQNISDTYNKRERRDLNHLLKLILAKLKRKMPEDLLSREIPQPPSKNVLDVSGVNVPSNQQQQLIEQQELGPKKVEDETWRAPFLLKQQITFAQLESKCIGAEYRDTEEFKADCQLIVHNVIVYHGVHSTISDQARQMFRDCVCDLRDIDLCRDCFRYSSETEDKYWFCKPCRPFHELVYARQKGFPYWPAKVIRTIENGTYDVRFFGGYHQRALVEKANVRPISVNIHTLQVRRTSSWNKACEELRKHQEYLTRVKDNPDFNKDMYGNPFVSDTLKVEFPESEGDEDDDEDEVESGRYPGDPERVEDAELLKKPNYVPGESPGLITQRAITPISMVNTGVNVNIVTDPSQLLQPQQIILQAPPIAIHHQQPFVGEIVYSEDPTKKKRGRPKKSKKEEAEDFVSSSSQQETRFINAGVQTPSKLLKPFHGSPAPTVVNTSPSDYAAALPSTAGLSSVSAAANASTRKPTEKEFKEFAEKLRTEFEQEKKRAVNVATRSLERDLERLKADHNTELDEMIEKHKQELAENKKKQWCYHCETEAIYWCCWNTAYCSIECQQEHWHKEHKRACRRKR